MNIRACGTCLCLSMALSTTVAFADREAQIDALQEAWSIEPSGQIADQLSRASTEELAAALEAVTIEELLEALDSNCNVETSNWAFTAVQPCRVADTRFATVDQNPISAGGTRDFFVWGSGLTTQNGGVGANNSDECPAPSGEPRAVHINVTAVSALGNGHLRIYPANAVTPNASFVNFSAPAIAPAIANAGTVKTLCEIGAPEIEVFASTPAHVIIDVMGYYYDIPAADPP